MLTLGSVTCSLCPGALSFSGLAESAFYLRRTMQDQTCFRKAKVLTRVLTRVLIRKSHMYQFYHWVHTGGTVSECKSMKMGLALRT